MKPVHDQATNRLKRQNGIEEATTHLSLAVDHNDYLVRYFERLNVLSTGYSKPFFRKWRARLYSVRHSTLDKAARYWCGLGKKPKVPVVNDTLRRDKQKTSKDRQRTARVMRERISPPLPK